MAPEFYSVMQKTVGKLHFEFDSEELAKRFAEWAASWDCTPDSGKSQAYRGDEINVGSLWEDKSVKDFKSYL